jgi:catechol 2,3-dioxygenase-like lactoylglutathione lyase family enzyme
MIVLVATLLRMNIVQVKIPCTDLRLSAAWYSALLDLEHHREFVEEGEVAGVVLAHPDGWVLGLRLRTRVPGEPAFPGFDLLSLSVRDRGELEALRARAATLGGRTGDIFDRGADGPGLDVFDPDGTAIRFLAPGTGQWAGFVGVEFNEGRPPTFYDQRRL